MVYGNRDACIATIYLVCSILLIPIKSSFNYFILWFHILYIPYILIFLEFYLEWIYPSFLRHTQGIEGYTLIKGGSVYEYPPIVEHIVEILLSHCNGLNGPDISTKEEQNRWICCCVIRGFMPFLFIVNGKLFLLNEVTSILHFKSLCCICIIPDLFPFLGLIILLLYSRPLFYRLLCHHLFDNIYAFFYVMGDLIYSKYLTFMDGKLVYMIQHGWPVV